MKKNRILALVLALAMVFSMTACGGETAPESSAPETSSSAPESSSPESSAPEGETAAFKFGGIGPLTGENAIYGKAVMNAVQIAVDEINAQGGIQIEFQPQDDEADGEKGINAYNTLKDWGMQALIGSVTTGSAIAVSAKLYEDRMFGLTPSASSADVTAGKDNMFQLCFTDPNQGIASAEYISTNMPDAKIAIIYRNDDAYSQGIHDAFVATLADKNIEAVYEGTFTIDTATDFSVQLGAAQSAGADLIFMPIYYQPASVILAQAKAMGYAPTFFGVDGMDGILTMEGFDTALAEGLMLLTPFSADATDEATVNFVNEYQKRYGDIPNQFAADGYDCVYAIYNALIASGCTPDMSAQDICEKLVAQFTDSSFTVDGLTGQDMGWSANGEVSKAPNIYVIQDGKYVAA
ncbi:MAG: ABC transporter substrate-binding protein [Candidatus Heteroscillospira sp.]|jgi:branched-chain amino acid transport system substrate-binding protein